MTPEERKRYDDDVKFRNAVCEHGSQRRKCNTCELLCEQHDNAALRARIAVLENQIKMRGEVATVLEEDNKRLREAVEWISNDDNYKHDWAMQEFLRKAGLK
jgi:hypothetical protein